MKKLIVGIVGFLLLCQGLSAQRITGAEYFFDTDPGVGHGTSLAVTTGDSVNIATNISVGALSTGFHKVFVRVMDSTHVWSLYEGRGFYVQPTVVLPAASQISSSEYFYDTDPGQGHGTVLPVIPGDSITQTNLISAAALTPGFHKVFIRTQNTDGTWSLYEGRGVYVQPTVTLPATNQISESEYFFDADPGVGHGTSISTTTADSVTSVQALSIASLTPGFHSVFVRTANTSKIWSLYEGRGFYVQPTITPVAAAQIQSSEYFFDTDPGQGHGTAIAITTADSVNVSGTAALAALSAGFHNVFLRTQNTQGVWSLYEGRNFYYIPASVVFKPSSKIVAAEYFFDSDPGVGQGTTLPGITAGDSLTMSTTFNASSLTLGSHNVFLRVKDSLNHWSLYEGRKFKVKNCSIATSTSVNNATCFGGSNGKAIALPVNGTLPYTYSWSSSPVQTRDTATGLPAGTYTLTVTDSAGCPANAIATIGQPAVISPTTTVVGTTCNQANGQALVSSTGGTGNYTYSWNLNPVQTTSSVSNLAAGNYTVTLTDAHNCSVSATATIGASTSPLLVTSTNKSKCGKHTGTATVVVSGGTTPYHYTWSNGSGTAFADSLSSGIYMVTVTDANNCAALAPAMVSDTLGPVIGVNAITPPNCFGQSSGAISISVIGGAAPYTYSWSNGSHSASISFLPAGPYQLTVTDAGHCMGTMNVLVTQPTAEMITLATTKASCGLADGTATLIATGGTTPYTFSWSTGANSATIGNLAAGSYNVKLIDNNGCLDSTQVPISNNGGPVVTQGATTNASCSAGTGGSIGILITGGTTPYTYSWSSGALTQNLAGVPSGNYHVLVTDHGGCVGTLDAIVAPTLPIGLPICMVTVDTITGKNQIIWNKSGSVKIKSFNIYKESTSSGVYFLAGNVPYNQLSVFTDTLANPQTRSWRYKISEVDSCGEESAMSPSHKTIHLTSNLGVGGVVNLIWDDYEGLTFGTYYVYRDTVYGKMTKIDSIPNNVFTYTDNSVPHATNIYYQIGIKNPFPCTPTRSSINFNSSRSNGGHLVKIPTGIREWEEELNAVLVYPNPSAGLFNVNLDLSNKQTLSLRVFNAMGQLLREEHLGMLTGSVRKQIDLSGFPKGVYFLQMAGDAGIVTRRIIID
jgi:hypothetical protein